MYGNLHKLYKMHLCNSIVDTVEECHCNLSVVIPTKMYSCVMSHDGFNLASDSVVDFLPFEITFFSKCPLTHLEESTAASELVSKDECDL